MFDVPKEYQDRRNLANAYTEGWRHGLVAGIGGIPLSKYKKVGQVRAFERGFTAAQLEAYGKQVATAAAFDVVCDCCVVIESWEQLVEHLERHGTRSARLRPIG